MPEKTSNLACMILCLALCVSEARANSINSTQDLCRIYSNQIIGHQQGAPIRISCAMIEQIFSDISRRQGTPPFRDMYLQLRSSGHLGLTNFIGDDPELKGRCRRERFTRERIFRCALPRMNIAFILGPQDQVDTIKVEIPANELLRGPMNVFASRFGIEPNANMHNLLLQITNLVNRRNSQFGELYSTDGNTVFVELRR